MAKNKVLIIGLDGTTYEIMEPFLSKGELPNIKKLMEDGCCGKVKSTIPPMSGSAWASIQTGVNPGKHGVFDCMLQKKKGEIAIEYINSTFIKVPTLWDLLGKRGKKVGVVNVMMTYPPKDINGYMITGGLTPPGERFYSPKDVDPEIKQILMNHIVAPYGGYDLLHDDWEGFLNENIRAAESKKEISISLMQRFDWDFFIVMFGWTDAVQHMLWKFIDKKSPLWKDSYANLKNPIHVFYQRMDEMIGDILKEADKNTSIVLLADHGFGPFYARININNFLRKKGYLLFKKGFWTFVRRTLLEYDLSLVSARKLAHKLGIKRLTEKFRGEKQEMLGKAALSLSDIDLSKTKAYSLGTCGGIFVNMKGRDPGGIIMPGKEYENLRDEIIHELKKLKDPRTGVSIIREVFKKEEILNGSHLDSAPDLIVVPERGFSPNGSYYLTSKRVVEITDYASATHEIDGGICVFSGNNINQGRHLSKDMSIMDVAPTVLYLLGVPIPDYFDGNVIEDVITEEYSKNYIPEYEKFDLNSLYSTKKGKPLTEKEIKCAKELIENLGYMPKK